MKKSLLSLTALVLGVSMLLGTANALEISDLFLKNSPLVNTAYTQLLNDYNNSWGYTSNVSLTCDSEGDTITIVTPKIDDSKYETAPEYRLFLSPYRISQIKSGDPTVDNEKITMIQQEIGDNVASLTFKVSSSDVKSDQAYYGFIVPTDIYDEVGTPSEEICFQLNKNVCMLDTECNTFDLVINPAPITSQDANTSGEGTSSEGATNLDGSDANETQGDEHGAASDCVSMKFANVSHTINGDNLTLTWTAVDGDTVDIAVWTDDEMWEKVATVKMSDEKYTYKIKTEGEQNFKLVNDCGEVNYKADAAIKESTPEKIVTPATGPAENIMYIAIAAIILYGAYTVFFRKSDNN